MALAWTDEHTFHLFYIGIDNKKTTRFSHDFNKNP